MVEYVPIRVVSVSSGAGWWAEFGSGSQVQYHPIAVFAVIEAFVKDQPRTLVVPLTDWELEHLNESIAGGLGMSEVLGSSLFHDSDFEVPGRRLSPSRLAR